MSRLKSIDVLRGLALAAILVDHMPLSVLGGLTPRNFALFDATELFVFMSGLSLAMVWGRAASRGARPAAARKLVARSGKIWMAYVATALALSAAALAMTRAGVAYEAVWSGYGDQLAAGALSHAASVALVLSQPNIADVLVMYVVLVAVSPLVAEGARSRPLATVAASAAVWAAAAPLGRLLPGETAAGPLFNPFAWQAVFAAGALAWFHGAAAVRRLGPIRPLVSAAAGAVLLLGLLVAKPMWFGTTHEALGVVPEQFTKWTVHPVRLLSFLSAFWLFVAFAPAPTSSRWDAPVPRALAAVGRNGLPCFCFGALLSLCFDAWGRWFGHPGGHLLADVAGLACLLFVALAAEGGVPAVRKAAGRLAVR